MWFLSCVGLEVYIMKWSIKCSEYGETTNVLDMQSLEFVCFKYQSMPAHSCSIYFHIFSYINYQWLSVYGKSDIRSSCILGTCKRTYVRTCIYHYMNGRSHSLQHWHIFLQLLYFTYSVLPQCLQSMSYFSYFACLVVIYLELNHSLVYSWNLQS